MQEKRVRTARRINGLRKVKCHRCGQQFRSKRRDAKWCPECKVIVRREKENRFERKHTAKCFNCGTAILRRSTLCHPCDNRSRVESNRGENNPNWKGGRIRNEGYVYLRVQKPNGLKHPYRAEHILVWEGVNGALPEGWLIHHLNGIRDDNRLENLAAMPRKRHNLKLAFEPYEKRIRELEVEFRKLK